MDRNEIINKLILADEEATLLSFSHYSVDVTIVGGGVLVIKELIFRQTPDIDTVGVVRGLDAIFSKYDINDRANAFSDCLAYNYEDRLEKIDIPTKTINYYMLSLEDVVIMKLHSGRGKDWKDITSPNVLEKINWDLLISIVNNGELDYQTNERAHSQFMYQFNKYVKEYKK